VDSKINNMNAFVHLAKSLKHGIISFIIVVLFYSYGFASSIEVNPIRLEILKNQKITSLEIKNNSLEAIVVQLNAVKWSHSFGKEIYDNTKEILITPPIVTINPNDTQLVRVGILSSRDSQKGETYRVFVREVPQAKPTLNLGVQTLLEISIPLLVESLSPCEQKLAVAASRTGSQELKVRVQNSGDSYIIINKVKIKENKEAKPLVDQTIYNYLLPTQTKEWLLQLPQTIKCNNVIVTIVTNNGEFSETIQL